MATGSLNSDYFRDVLKDKDDDEMSDSNTGEQVLYCGGEAWIENVDGSGKRRKLGPFSLTKQKTVDRSQLIYTVPASRGVSDTTEDEID